VKLLKLKVAGFGPLRGEWTFDPERANLVVDDNERGKTSLLAAITAALYGLEDDRRSHRVLTPLERWRPWTGGAYGVELELDVMDGPVRIVRDFERGTVAVYDAGGREVTAEYLDGRDEFPVGHKLLGLDIAEFEKCALVRQGDLDAVVPGDERARRGSTLKARLENAADTHIGDTNASEALRVLEEALRRYNAPELEFTGTVDNAIERLEAKRVLTETDLHDLDHQLSLAHGPLETLAQLSDEELALKETLRRLEAERHAGLAAEVRRQIDDNERSRTELEALEREAAELEFVARLPQNAEAELREAVARLEEAERNIETLEARRNEESGRERSGVETEMQALGAFRGFTEDDANRCVALAAELRRLSLEDARLRQQVFELRDQLAAQGYEPERIQVLTGRFNNLPDAQQRLMRQQTGMSLEFQTEVARLEQERTSASETLRNVDASRNGRRVPGWIALTLGLGGAVAGVVVVLLKGGMVLFGALLGGGGVVAILGAALLAFGSRALAVEHDSALQRLGEAQRRLNLLRTQRAGNDAELSDLARHMGYRDAVDLMRHWTEYLRVVEDSAPLLRAQEQLATCDSQRRLAIDQAHSLMRIQPDVPATPEALERVAYEGRRAVALQTRLAELDRSSEWVDKERKVDEAAIAGLRERAVRILQSAGLTFDPERSWAQHIQDLAGRASQRARRTVVIEELIPYAKQRLVPAAEVEQRRKQLEQLHADPQTAAAARPAVEIDIEAKQARLRMETVQEQRADLRVQVEEVWRRHAQQRPELEATLDRLAQAAVRARGFKQSVELARTTIQKVAVDTHRRWADFLNVRVSELLGQFGTRVDQLRFGEDLDFSLQLDGGPQVSRGKAHLQLSTGARDQLYLAVRLAVSEYLSRGGEPLPLLLDDAFATSDDARLRAGMRALLGGFATGHQVIVVTCHRGRHVELQRQDPELYRDRVHWLDVGIASSSQAGAPR
jgi:DNA repair exonuclease SbcCD ATPase subunit